jgi:hypothetical protein
MREVIHEVIHEAMIFQNGKFVSHHHNLVMLTLSQPTLYYMNLSRGDTIQKGTGIIKNWATAVDKLAAKPSSTAASRTLVRSTTTSRRPTAPTKKTVVPPDDDAESIGPVSDRDETIGNERDAAVKSPLKNGARATSSVSPTCSSIIYYKHAK